MPRVKRGLSDGLIYHVLNRGNGKEKIFHKEEDLWAFIELIKEAKKRYPLDIFAYCLMPNHFHIVVRPFQANYLSKWMQWLMTSHVRRYHRHYKTTGHIWQGRFKSFIIQKDEHLLTVLRYVERNPVRARLVFSAKDWNWSSHKERISEESEKVIDNIPINLPNEWSKYVDEPLTEKELEKLRQSVIRQSPFGNVEWQKRISQKLGLEHTLKPRGRPRKGIE